ncbi:polysaccharide deacetylase family protein [Streptomyces sp. NPDC053427]|uniref:polysaccharide deacetylase family protein n=1 Tax=Streptomyces sp. NPDC053427 TaxID=3365701 RepID=UPI0037D679BE
MRADENDPRTPTRRLFLRGGLAVGLLGVGRLLTASDAQPPQAAPWDAAELPKPHPTAGAPPPRIQGALAQRYRLRPMAGETSLSGPGASPVHPDVAFRLPTQGREVALTFDDGPDPRCTPKILRTLRRHDIRATFFIVGESAAAFPGLLREIVDDGHAVANHSWTHPQLTALPPAKVYDQLGRTSSMVADTLGTAPRLARAPYGAWDEPSLSICSDLGMSPVGWSIDSADWTRPGPKRIATTVLRGMAPGAIVLSHDGGGERAQTVAALAWYLPRLLDHGYRPIRIEA